MSLSKLCHSPSFVTLLRDLSVRPRPPPQVRAPTAPNALRRAASAAGSSGSLAAGSGLQAQAGDGGAVAGASSLFGAPPGEDTAPGGFTRADRMYDIADTGGHVVIINPSGTGWWQVEGVAEALRAAQYGVASTVVVLSPTPPPAGLLLRHRHIFAAQGNAQDPEAMLAAGVDTARRVIYLAGGSFEDADATAADRRAVLSTNILERQHEEWRKDVFTVVELHVRFPLLPSLSSPRAHAPLPFSRRAGPLEKQPRLLGE